MKLKYNNSCGMIVLANQQLTLSNIYSLEIIKVAFKNKFYWLFFHKEAYPTHKKLRLSITFSSLAQIKQIKSSNVDKNNFIEKKIILFQNFVIFLCCPPTKTFGLLYHNFFY